MTARQSGARQSKALHDLSSVVMSLIRSPPTPISFSGEDSFVAPADAPASSSRRRPSAATQITPAGFASLLLGASLTLMVCGSLTFFIGFMLMPWVFGLIMFLYLAGVVSALSVAGRSFFSCGGASRPDPPQKLAS